MKLVLAPNALKGSLSAADATAALARGFRRGLPDAELLETPVADGGDSTAEVVTQGLGGTMLHDSVSDPLGRSVNAAWGWIASSRTAVVDVAAASGLRLLSASERDPMRASSAGTGQLLARALERGARRIVLGVGGSATVDGGAGLLQALGANLYDARGRPIEPGAAGLSSLAHVDMGAVRRRFAGVELVVLCDVDNPLLGQSGAARVFGPQKGATPQQVENLERALANFADRTEAATGAAVHRVARGGAAGGIAAFCQGWLDARLDAGIDWVLDALDFERRLAQASWVVTAEGWLDRQTLNNKAPFGVARRAARAGVPAIVLCGGVDDDFVVAEPFTAVFPICRRPVPVATAIEHAGAWLSDTAEQLGRLLRAGTLSCRETQHGGSDGAPRTEPGLPEKA